MNRLSKILGAATLAASLVAAPTASFAGVFVGIGIGINVNFAPPPLPVYVQPPCPQPNYLWTPGYWGYEDAGYYWVPGAWVAPPQIGFLWTPGYWGYGGGLYAWHPGYWGPHVGFYGGVSYGGGYFGHGFYGGGWFGGAFRYNTAYANVNRTVINNTYVNRTVINNYNNSTINRVSYNGGPGGLAARATPEEQSFRNEQHAPATFAQREQVSAAAQNRGQFANVNHGRPEQTAIDRPLNRQTALSERGIAGDRMNESRPSYANASNEDRTAQGRPSYAQNRERAAQSEGRTTQTRPSYASPARADRNDAFARFNRTSAQGDRAFQRPSYARNAALGERTDGYRGSAAASNRYRATPSNAAARTSYRPQNHFSGGQRSGFSHPAASRGGGQQGRRR